MARLIAGQLALGILTVLGAALAIFIATEMLPGDIAQTILGPYATPEGVAAIRLKLGLDVPAYIRFLRWLGDFLRGDMGQSLAASQFGSVTTINGQVALRLSNTLILAGSALAIALPPALILAMFAATRPNHAINRVVNLVSLSAISLPEFFIAYVLIALIAVRLRWLPAMAAISPDMSALEILNKIALPVFTLVAVSFAYLLRLSRACLSDVLSRPFIEMAALKGLPTWRIVAGHAFPNALGPIASVVALTLAYLVVGAVVVEVVFVYPGMGQYLVDAVSRRDVPVVQACSLIFASIYVGLNLIADLVGILANPRLRYPR
jgi:peptide/nickel transport system permease protein